MVMVSQSDPRLYMRLASHVREQIMSGELTAGDRLPSIGTLCREHATSRRTAGRAMRLLEDEGWLVRVPGLGYFVRD
ncbi:MAG TPA: winged helix-turn-helix domain-containing protein [Streptosporangiaceae bacterium]|nr:winged helix-turn-helix domain-containing protein [Streptosporangiaceae bacterium]